MTSSVFSPGIPCVGVWAVGGLFLRKYLMKPRFALSFNITMAITLLAAVLPAALKLMNTHIGT
ncbi:hypothetical protein [Acinetobacter johnsonii]|uniref:hypothetical protein n=1 Tax=Acinetobacter johnsonii TaxID=40214 RepID=UPI0032B325F6